MSRRHGCFVNLLGVQSVLLRLRQPYLTVEIWTGFCIAEASRIRYSISQSPKDLLPSEVGGMLSFPSGELKVVVCNNARSLHTTH